MPLLSKDRSRWWFVQELEKARRKHEFDLWAWVIMPEHVHLLIWPRRAVYRMAKILASIKKPVGAKAIAYLKVEAPGFLQRLTVRHRNRTYHRFWQAGPGRDQNLYEPATIHRAIEHIHNNPVQRGLVARAADWPWSSAADWAGLEALCLRVDHSVPPIG